MILNRKQEEGLKIAVSRYKSHEPWTCIAGYAGSGKSTLVTFIIQALNLDYEDVAYVAYTGKAALVLKEKGCPNATTAHRLLYQSYPRNDGTFYHKIKRPLDHPYKLIVVDEISMLPKDMWDLLLTHKIPIIALGDPGQLEPIGEDNGVLEHPHIFLDEVMRQAQESEIIRLTMDIRDKKPLKLFKGNEVQIYSANELCDGMLNWADQILCGKNVTRKYLNNLRRKQLFDTEDATPLVGDKIICLRNDYDIVSNSGEDPLINGMVGTLSSVKFIKGYPFLGTGMIGTFSLNEEDKFEDLNMDLKIFIAGKPFVNKDNFKKIPKPMKPKEFDYGYAITYWKAQGSEWDNVLVLEENWPRQEDSHRRALYTAATRAKKKLVIIRNYWS